MGGDGTLQEIHGYDEAQRTVFGARDEAFHARQRSAIDAHVLSGMEVGPGYEHGLGVYQRAEIVDLALANWRRSDADAENLLDARGLQDRSEERRVGKECRSRRRPYH